ncbi:metabolite traffic protein EboE [Nibrella viscosa]|uniref:Metabolite traffic protein EboE n=1 Tax=Nibrella viscosa TaxID=1084524 RepID=A0ABP8KCG9_9BACT
MKTSLGHLSYCTNIHAGEHWSDHFMALQRALPGIKQQLSPGAPFGLGLRLSDVASQELCYDERLKEFKQWLADNNLYVFTMNGFPFGGFHRVRVKDEVHKPDWTTEDRVQYTIRLFRLLADLLPAGMAGGVSTSPLSYRHWFNWADRWERDRIYEATTQSLMDVVEELVRIRQGKGVSMHLDIEPEPDGVLETADEFIDWFNQYLRPIGIERLNAIFGMTVDEAEEALREHVQLCYDVCHFAVGFERPDEVLDKLKKNKLRVGKIQISAALKATFPPDKEGRELLRQEFTRFNEPTYLHQVVATNAAGELSRYPDLPEALAAFGPAHAEWRSHFHVPIFVSDYGRLQSTQSDIAEVLRLQKEQPFTEQLEAETYTWEVLPEGLKMPINDSIVRELKWVLEEMNNE